jgi:membrane protease YdiL (CAAX protease family)
MIYSLIYLETKTLVVPVILHAMHNALALASTIVAHLSSANQDVEVSFRDLWYGLINTALALPVLFYFIKWLGILSIALHCNKESEETS